MISDRQKDLPVRHAGLAQLVEHLICNQEVGGSSPSAGTNIINGLKELSHWSIYTSKHIVSAARGFGA